MKKFLRYILVISMTFAFLPIAIGSLRDLGSPFIIIADFLQTYAQLIWVITAFSGGTSGIMLIILQLKEQKANIIVAKAAVRDEFWNEADIKNRCRLVFYSVFDAISNGDITQIESFVTTKFCREIMSTMAEWTAVSKEIINPVDIKDTKIVASTDRIENNLDEVTVCLIGDFVRPADGTDLLATNFEVEKMRFQILCTLKRQDQQWKLDEIDDYVTLFDLLIRTRSHYEG